LRSPAPAFSGVPKKVQPVLRLGHGEHVREPGVAVKEIVHLVALEGIDFYLLAHVYYEQAAPGGELLLEAPKRREQEVFLETQFPRRPLLGYS
jgi:hypothetical protein